MRNKGEATVVEITTPDKFKADKGFKRFESVTTAVSLLVFTVVVAILALTRVYLGTAGTSKRSVEKLEISIMDSVDRIKEVIGWVDIKEKKLNLPESLIDKSNEIGISQSNGELLKSLATNNEKQTSNFFYSPASLNIALQMLAYAAEEDTYSQLIGYTGRSEHDLNSKAVTTSNTLLHNEALTKASATSEYSTLLGTDSYLNAKLYNVKSSNISTTVLAVNRAIKRATGNKVEEAVSDLDLQGTDFILNLINTLRFSGSLNANVRVGESNDFTKADGTVIRASYMNITEGATYWSTPTAEGFKVNYKENDGRYTFIGFLPKESITEYLPEDLDLTNLKEPSYEYSLNVKVPEFEMLNTIDCSSSVRKLGIEDAFASSKANLTDGFDVRIYGKNVYVTGLKQITTMGFTSDGNETYNDSGKTEVKESVEEPVEEITPIELNFNRPFLFTIWDNEEELPVLIGQVFDPTE